MLLHAVRPACNSMPCRTHRDIALDPSPSPAVIGRCVVSSLLMKRLLWRIFWSTSLLIAISTSVLWWRSYHAFDSYGQLNPNANEDTRWFFVIASMKGDLTFKVAVFQEPDMRPLYPIFSEFEGFHSHASDPSRYDLYIPNEINTKSTSRGLVDPIRLALGDVIYFNYLVGPMKTYGIVIPHYSVVVAGLFSPGIAIVFHLRVRRRSMKGLCPACGYDLRATPERCPECGLIPGKSGVL